MSGVCILHLDTVPHLSDHRPSDPSQTQGPAIVFEKSNGGSGRRVAADESFIQFELPGEVIT